MRLGIDPADVAVAAPIDKIEPAMTAVAEQHEGVRRDLKLHHRLANRELRQHMARLGDHSRIEALRLRLILAGGADDIARGFLLPHRLAPRFVMVLEALLVAAQLLFEMAGSLIEARMGIGSVALCLEHEAGGKMQSAIRMETHALLLDRYMRVNGALEIFLLKLEESVLDMLAQGLADIEIFTSDFDLHGRRKYPCFALAQYMGAFASNVNGQWISI